jgi:adenylylsulfate kinase
LSEKRKGVKMASIAIWITGLPGSGKSTVADEIKKLHPGFLILRMDELRKVVTPEPTYSDAERDMVYRALVYLAGTLTELGHSVIIDATGNLKKWRELARERIPGYTEVYLKCPLELCMEREQMRTETHDAPRDIYRKGGEGWPVPGVSVPYEEPLNPEITINVDKTSLRKMIEAIEKEIIRLNPKDADIVQRFI